MTTTHDQTTAPVELDTLTNYLAVLEHARRERDKWQQTYDVARKVIEDALGQSEIGTVAGRPAVRWTVVTTNRVNTTALKKAHPDLVEQFTTMSVSRRFTLVDQDGAA